MMLSSSILSICLLVATHRCSSFVTPSRSNHRYHSVQPSTNPTMSTARQLNNFLNFDLTEKATVEEETRERVADGTESKSSGPMDSIFEFFFGNRGAGPSGNSSSERRREELKASLLEECQRESAPKNRARVEELISELAPLCPTVASAGSKILQKKWLLQWTTEKEINVFNDWGISADVSQTINGLLLENRIEFKKGGYLGVSGALSVPDKNGKRTDFAFTTATLDLAKWGLYRLPPVGKGWFDTVYLDEGLRVDLNSRDDILICTPL